MEQDKKLQTQERKIDEMFEDLLCVSARAGSREDLLERLRPQLADKTKHLADVSQELKVTGIARDQLAKVHICSICSIDTAVCCSHAKQIAGLILAQRILTCHAPTATAKVC